MSNTEEKEANRWWLAQMRHWDVEGTIGRICAAQDNATPVKVRHSSGEISVGVITGGGFGTRAIEVGIDGPDGKLFKMNDTDEFLELNPELGRSWIELNPEYRAKD